MEEEKKEVKGIREGGSGVTGRALVEFGGKVGVSIATYDDGAVSVGFSELKSQHEVGEDIGENESYDTQVRLVFTNLKSLDMVRNVLDMVERILKDGVPADWIEEYKKKKEERTSIFIQDNIDDET